MKKHEGIRKSRKQSNSDVNIKVDQDLFSYLPSEIILNILSRVPAPTTTMRCKCVCKPWFDLLMTPEFVQSHLSKSVPGLAVFLKGENSKPYRIVEFEDEHRWNIVFNFDLPFHEPLISSANGLVLLCKGGLHRGSDLSLCNPITRDYITIPSPQQPSSKPMFLVERYGFGVSRMSGQFKVVRLFIQRPIRSPLWFNHDQFECQVYTVGTGSWRGIASDSSLRYEDHTAGAFLNGNLHWLAHKGSSTLISYLDLESELFSTFLAPPLDDIDKCGSLSVLGDCLCVCDNFEYWQTAYEIDIWLMKEYEDDKSWTKEFVIRKVDMDDYLGYLVPIKVFKDGDILMEVDCCNLLYYSSKTNTIQEAGDVLGLESNSFRSITIFSPSFLSLKTFAMENVTSFCFVTTHL